MTSASCVGLIRRIRSSAVISSVCGAPVASMKVFSLMTFRALSSAAILRLPDCHSRYCAPFFCYVRCGKYKGPGRHSQGIPVDEFAQLDLDNGQQCPRSGGAMGDRNGRTLAVWRG